MTSQNGLSAQNGYVVHEGCDHIFFVGFHGAGKSTIVRKLGQLFGRAYVDTDRLAERDCHCSVADVFAEQGESVFRDAETAVLRKLAMRKSLLVSCGGGIVERDENLSLMHEMGSVLWLDCKLEDSLRHIQRPDRRPELSALPVADELYERRRPLYERAADIHVEVADRSFEELAELCGQILWERGLL